jgi:putative heme iron utilization protein
VAGHAPPAAGSRCTAAHAVDATEDGMKEAAAVRAGALVARTMTASLGTLHEGAPSVTMVPFAPLREPFGFVVLVSDLASHTRDMVAEARVALLVVEREGGDTPPHALARVAVQGLAHRLDPADPRHAAARAAYEGRFPDMAGLFELGDFRLFAIAPTTVRVVLGFAQATSLTPATLAAALPLS